MIFTCQAGRITSRLMSGFYEKSLVKKVIVVWENLFRTNFSPSDSGVCFSSDAPVQKLLSLADGFNRINGTKNPQRIGGD